MKNLVVLFALLLLACVLTACNSSAKKVDWEANRLLPASSIIGTALDAQPSARSECGVSKSKKVSLVIHGGVGYKPSDEQTEFVKTLLIDGQKRLNEGERALDVVQRSVEAMENSGIFNTGKGGVRTNFKTVELDASIMDGKDMSAGAVASLKDVKNPIRLARFVKERTPHLLMVGAGASSLAKEKGFEMVSPDYFTAPLEKKTPGNEKPNDQKGTVGAVAIDRCSDIAAATSTGGLDQKLPGRVGDSPIIGAGTYANNEACGVSATGDGEKFIRATVAARICFSLQYLKRDLKTASRDALKMVERFEGTGGLIAIAKNHEIVAETTGNMPMLSGWIHESGGVTLRKITD